MTELITSRFSKILLIAASVIFVFMLLALANPSIRESTIVMDIKGSDVVFAAPGLLVSLGLLLMTLLISISILLAARPPLFLLITGFIAGVGHILSLNFLSFGWTSSPLIKPGAGTLTAGFFQTVFLTTRIVTGVCLCLVLLKAFVRNRRLP